jgi:hypothetical protein
MALFSKKTPMEKWRSRNRMMASFVDHAGWDVHLDSGVVTTIFDGVPVTVMIQPGGNSNGGVIIEAGAQAERSLANTVGDDGGEPFEFEGWQGVAAPGSGLIEGHGSGPDFNDKVMAAAVDLVDRVRRAR